MVDELWYVNLKYVLFTQFQTYVKNFYGDGSQNIVFTIESNNVEPTQFPTVLFDELPATERGMDLNNVTVNGLYETIQIKVYSQDKTEAKSIMAACVVAMKKMRFTTTFPQFYTNHDIKYGVARFRRMVGACDFF